MTVSKFCDNFLDIKEPNFGGQVLKDLFCTLYSQYW